MKLTKEQSLMIKGIAILMMLAHHLFAYPEKISDVHFDPFWIKIGLACKICVSIYIFLSGYGLALSMVGKEIYFSRICQRVVKLYKSFWKYFIPFSLLGIVVGYYKFALGSIFLDLFCFTQNYYHESWFILVYVACLLCLPLFLKIRKASLLMLVIIVLTMVFRMLQGYMDLSSFWMRDLYLYGQYLSSFLMGVFFARVEFKVPSNWLSFMVLLALSVLLFVLRNLTGWTWLTILITPGFVFLCSFISRLPLAVKTLCFFGRSATGMWLIHCYFLYYFLKYLLFNISHSPYILFIMLVCYSLIATMALDWVYKLCKGLWGKCRKNI